MDHSLSLPVSWTAVFVTALAALGDTLTMDDQAVVLWGPIDPSTECAYIDGPSSQLGFWRHNQATNTF